MSAPGFRRPLAETRAPCAYCGREEASPGRHPRIVIDGAKLPFCMKCSQMPERIEAVKKSINQEID